ncbi:MAG: MFS transporter [Alphaproteobacteria bacterium]
MHGIGAALRVRNYRLYVSGGLVSLIGTWMQRIGVGWLMWQMTESGTWLGLAAMADLMPGVVVGPVAGVLADRLDRLRTIRLAQVLMLIQGLALWACTAAGLMTPGLLLLLVLFGGVVVGVNQPARLALIPSLVPRALLATAVAVNAVTFNLARFIGPALAGFVILNLDVATVFLLNGLSFTAFIVTLSLMQLPPQEAGPTRRQSIVADIVQGLRYTAGHPGIGPILALMTVLSLGARPFVELMPGLVDAVFGSGADGLAALSSIVGLGAICSGLWMASRGARPGLARVTLGATALAAASIGALALSPGLGVAMVCAACAGVAMVICGVGTQTLLQMSVAGEVRGRVLSLYGIIFRSGPAAGAFVMGLASEFVGLRWPLAIGAGIAFLMWAWLWRRRGAIAAALEGDQSSP